MAKGEIFTGLPKWAQGLIAVGIVGGVGYLGYTIYKNFKEKQSKKDSKAEVDAVKATTQVLQAKGMKPTLDNLKLNTIANQLETAMNGYGTDVSSVYRAFANVKNDFDVVNLIKVYNVRKLSSGKGNIAPDFTGTLAASIEEELNTSEKKALNDSLSRKGINYRF